MVPFSLAAAFWGIRHKLLMLKHSPAGSAEQRLTALRSCFTHPLLHPASAHLHLGGAPHIAGCPKSADYALQDKLLLNWGKYDVSQVFCNCHALILFLFVKKISQVFSCYKVVPSDLQHGNTLPTACQCR